MIGIVVFIVLLGLLFFNVPIAIGTGLAAYIGILSTGDLPIAVLVQRMFVGLDTFTLIAIPLFIFTGRMMALGGVTRDLINLSSVLV